VERKPPVPRVPRGVLFTACAAAFLAPAVWAQGPPRPVVPPVPNFADLPDAQRTRTELMTLLQRYPPAVRLVLSMDPALLSNEAYLAPYPGLSTFLKAHPEIQRNPGFYLPAPQPREDPSTAAFNRTTYVLDGLGGFAAAGMAIGLFIWLTRTLIDYRRWSRLAKVQTEFQSKILDRFSANADLLAYVQSPAGAKFMEFSPIALDAAPRSMGAPLGRIMWTLQAGVVLLAAGIGLQVVSTHIDREAAPPLHVLGVLGIALGLGFLVSAVASFVISSRLGLIESSTTRDTPGGRAGFQHGNLP
jgi:hypothetical protein